MSLKSKKIIKRNIKENWVEKTLNRRFKKPIYLTVLLIFGFISYLAYIEYSEINDLKDIHTEVLNDIDKNKQQLKDLSQLSKTQIDSIKNAKEMILDDSKPIMFLTKVCDLLKNKELIGSYYISKKLSSQYKNVIILDVKIAFGDKALLKNIGNMILDKIFYVKEAKITKTGASFELYKPIKN